jgi:hypothetical protein
MSTCVLIRLRINDSLEELWFPEKLNGLVLPAPSSLARGISRWPQVFPQHPNRNA